jgi:hypothetical protein
MSESYSDRNLDIQIRIDNLLQAHDQRYPLSWYESLTDMQIRALYTDAMVRYANNLIGALQPPASTEMPATDTSRIDYIS